MKQAPLHFN